MQTAWTALNFEFDRDDNPISRSVQAVVEYAFPWSKGVSKRERLAQAFKRLREGNKERFDEREFNQHDRHRIKTTRGWIEGA
jgi:hypothetical protein